MEQDDPHPGAKMASAATAAAGAGSDDTETMTDSDVDMEMEDADMMRWTEADFEEKCTYIVKDTTWEAGPDADALTTTRAETSLPRNLAFKHPAESKEVRHKYTHTHTFWQTYKLSLQSNYFSHKSICNTHTHL